MARLLGVTRQAVQQWAKDGAPHTRDGHRLAFRLADVVNWRIDHAKAANPPRDFAEERLRKMKAEADRVEIEVAATRGQLIHQSVFEEYIGKEHDRTRAVVVSLLGNYARMIDEATGASIGTAQNALADLTNAILTELQEPDDDDPEGAR